MASITVVQAQHPNLGLRGQVNTYIAGGPAYAPSRTLFTILIGGNDLLEYLRGESDAADHIALLIDAMSNIQTAITDLYDDGATHFLVLNLPDLAATPRFNALPNAADITSVRALTLNFNTALSTLVGNLRNNLSGVTIHYFDTYAYLNDMIAGGYFAESQTSWLTLDGSYVPTGATNGPEEDYLFWDAIHPMTRAHEYLGNRAARSVMTAEEDDDSTCFITGVLHRSAATPASGIVLVLMGLTTLLFGKNRP
jgi:thermolabile hemolysin